MEKLKNSRLSIGEILSITGEIFSKRITSIISIILIVYIPIDLLIEVYNASRKVTDFSGLADNIRFMNLLENLIGIIATMAIVYLVERELTGNFISVKDALNSALKKWGNGLGATILSGFITFFLLLLLIVPGIIWMVYYTFILYAIILREQKASESLQYSKDLVKGDWWSVCGITFLFGIIVAVSGFAVAFAFGLAMPVEGSALRFITNVLIDLTIDIISSFFIVATTILFLNLDYLKKGVVEEPTIPQGKEQQRLFVEDSAQEQEPVVINEQVVIEDKEADKDAQK